MLTRGIVVCVALSSVLGGHAWAAPGPATPLTPNGQVTGSTIAFSWDAVPEATWYLLWIGTPAPSALVHQQWYTAAQAGCLGGGTCTVTLTPPLKDGGHLWFVQTWGGGEAGPWSAGRAFQFKEPVPSWGRMLPDARRFTLVFDDQAVLDNETGLTWQRTPGAPREYSDATAVCLLLGTAGRHGWRLPTASELGTLGKDGAIPSLPSGHPFDLGAELPRFWSQTSWVDGPDLFSAWFDLSPMGFNIDTRFVQRRTWCVRAPTGATR